MENFECGGTACDVSGMIPTEELEAERLRLAIMHDYADSNGNTIRGHHTYSGRGRRSPKAGHYPMNFSPYRMCGVKRGIVPLSRGFVKEDFKANAHPKPVHLSALTHTECFCFCCQSMKVGAVGLQGCSSCDYFTEDLS
jgi:hypothetical protein